MQFSNLFNGDKTLSDGTNRFLNENWLDILTELKPVLKKAIGNICNGVVGPIFAKFPYNDLFLWFSDKLYKIVKQRYSNKVKIYSKYK